MAWHQEGRQNPPPKIVTLDVGSKKLPPKEQSKKCELGTKVDGAHVSKNAKSNDPIRASFTCTFCVMFLSGGCETICCCVQSVADQ